MRSLCVLLMTLFFTATATAHDLNEDVELAYAPSLPAPVMNTPSEPLASLTITLVPVTAAQPAGGAVPGQVALKLEEPLNACDVAYDLTMTWVKPDEWKAKVKTVKSKFADWEAQNDGDMCRYLNDRLICVAMGCSGGKIEELKDGFAFLALYKEFNIQAPGLIERIFHEHRESLLKLFGDFTWERASEYVRNKEWRKDIPVASAKTADNAR